MVGGHDNDLSSILDCEQIVNEFLRLVACRWASATFHITDDAANEEFFASSADLPLTIDSSHGTVTICRDSGMKEHLDRFGLEPMVDGEGPMVLFFWRRPLGCDLDLVTSAPSSENNFSAWAVEQLSAACSVKDG